MLTAKTYGTFKGRPRAAVVSRLEALKLTMFDIVPNSFGIYTQYPSADGESWVTEPDRDEFRVAQYGLLPGQSLEMWTYGPARVDLTIANGVVIDSTYWLDDAALSTGDKIGQGFAKGVISIASGGWSSAFEQVAMASESGDWGNAALTTAKAYYGADDGGASDTATTAATETGSASMDWDGWNFSSGEAETAFSDATNVDFGLGDWGSNIDWAEPATGLDGYPLDVDQAIGDTYVFNAIPEVTTSDFGTSFSNLFGNTKDVIDSTVKGIQLAQTVKAITTKPTGGQVASSGGSGAKTTSTTAGDVLSSFGKMLSQLSPKTSGAQAQTTQQQTYSGQLTPAGGALPLAAGGISSSTLLMIGGGLIVGALVLHSLKG